MNARQRRDRCHQQVLRTRGLLRQLRREKAMRERVDRIMQKPNHLVAALFGVTGETDEELDRNLRKAGIARSYQPPEPEQVPAMRRPCYSDLTLVRALAVACAGASTADTIAIAKAQAALGIGTPDLFRGRPTEIHIWDERDEAAPAPATEQPRGDQ